MPSRTSNPGLPAPLPLVPPPLSLLLLLSPPSGLAYGVLGQTYTGKSPKEAVRCCSRILLLLPFLLVLLPALLPLLVLLVVLWDAEGLMGPCVAACLARRSKNTLRKQQKTHKAIAGCCKEKQ